MEWYQEKMVSRLRVCIESPHASQRRGNVLLHSGAAVGRKMQVCGRENAGITRRRRSPKMKPRSQEVRIIHGGGRQNTVQARRSAGRAGGTARVP